MEMVTEVMGDAIDDALEGDEEEEETEEQVNQVLDEIGIEVNQEITLSLQLLLLHARRLSVWCLVNHPIYVNYCCLYLQLVNAPSSAVAAPAAKGKVAQVETTGDEDSGTDSDLQARLDNLRRMWSISYNLVI